MNSLNSYIIFWIIDIFLLTLGLKFRFSSKYKTLGKFLVFCSCAVYVLVATNRTIEVGVNNSYSIGGIDANQYRTIFYSANMNLPEYLTRFHGEIGFNTALWLFYRMFGDFKVFLFALHLSAFILFYNFLKKELLGNFNYIYVLSLSIFILTIFNTMRCDFSILLWLNAFTSIKEKKYRKTFIFILIALSFHSASLIILPFILIYIIQKKGIFKISDTSISNKTVIIFSTSIYLVCFYVFGNFVTRFLLSSSELSVYADDVGVAVSTYIYVLFLLYITYVEFHRIKSEIEDNESYTCSLIVTLSILPIQMNFFMAYRFLLFFLGINIVYSIKLITTIYKRDTIKNLAYKSILYMYLIYRIYNLFFVQIPGAGIIR